jgi:hypothetical protein
MPGGFLREADEAVLDHRCLRVHAHDLVGLRLVAGDGGETVDDQFLDQLGAGGLDLPQHDARLKCIMLLAHGALEPGYSVRRRSRCNRERCLPWIPQLVHTLKSLSLLALLAVSSSARCGGNGPAVHLSGNS